MQRKSVELLEEIWDDSRGTVNIAKLTQKWESSYVNKIIFMDQGSPSHWSWVDW